MPGPLVGYIEKRGLRFTPARTLKYRPAPSRIAQLAMIASREKIDLFHCYEWPTCLDAYYGAGLLVGKPVLCTVLSMQVSPYVPPSVPLIMGTEDLGDEARRSHGGPVWVLEPPIDSDSDSPAIDGSGFRRHHEVGEQDILIVTVSRLALDLKLDALVRAIDAVDMIAARSPVRLVLVGEARLDRRSRRVLQRSTPATAGLSSSLPAACSTRAKPMRPRMSSSAWAARPCGRCRSGARSSSRASAPSRRSSSLRPMTCSCAKAFMASPMMRLARSALRRSSAGSWATRRCGANGRFGREVVTTQFSLKRAAQVQLDIYDQILAMQPRRRLGEAVEIGRPAR